MRLLITGGTGSLGQALTRYVLERTDWRVTILSRDEVKQAKMANTFNTPQVDFFLGDVRDEDRLALACLPCDAVVHAAALKRVDTVAHDPDEVFKTNVLGTRNVLRAAHQTGVHRVLLISSDKACYATNAYGVSKAMAEWMTVLYNVYGYPSGTRSSVLRYGNVLGSRGSVVHVWRTCAEPLPITDTRMTRFVITMPQAVELVYNVLEEMQGGEIFVPVLPAMAMVTCAEAIRPGVMRREIGMRPGGEKLHETLLTEEEAGRAVQVGRVLIVPPYTSPWTTAPAWNGEPPWTGGALRSDGVTALGVAQLQGLLNQVPQQEPE